MIFAKRSTSLLWATLLLLSSVVICHGDASVTEPETKAKSAVDESSTAAATGQTKEKDQADPLRPNRIPPPKERQRMARFVHKTIIIPHDDKKFRGGEDAASTIDTMLVVADGVGGWANKGVNPGLYSRKLTETITSKFAALSQEDQDSLDFKKLLHEANHEAAAEHLGSATCTVVRLKNHTHLETLNVGDSTYSIHRRIPKDRTKEETRKAYMYAMDESELTAVYAAEPGQKGFNFPYQLGGQYGDQVHDPGAADGPRYHELQDKDIIVVVSDGVNDNMDPDEYHECINAYQWTNMYRNPTTAVFNVNYKGFFEDNEIVSFSAVADCIARKAYHLGKDPKHYSPFAKSAAKYGKRYLGGKHDDITVTVAQVEQSIWDYKEGKETFSVHVDVDDPYKKESIFVYEDAHGEIKNHTFVPKMDAILNNLMYQMDLDYMGMEGGKYKLGGEL